MSAYLDTYIELEPGVVVDSNELEEQAKEEAPLRNRIDALRKDNRLLDVPADESDEEELDLTPMLEPVRKSDLLDVLRRQVLEYSKHFREESKVRIAGSRKVAKMIQAHFERVAGVEDRNKKLEEKRLRLLAKSTMKTVTQQWKLAVLVCSFLLAARKDADSKPLRSISEKRNARCSKRKKRVWGKSTWTRSWNNLVRCLKPSISTLTLRAHGVRVAA